MRTIGRLLVMVVMVGSTSLWAADGVLPGSGTEGDPYLIEGLADFDEFADSVNAATYWASGVYTRLACDIDLAGRTYTTAVIAPDTDTTNRDFDGTPFEGIFDGDGHVISNLSIDTTGARNDFLGLFGRIEGPNAEVKDLGMENINITGGDGSGYLGGLCGYNNRGTISNCYATGSVSSGDDSGLLGGLCGANSRLGSITNCYATGSVTAGDGSTGLGGLCGYNYDGTISNCHATVSVTGGDESRYIGGLCGRNYGTITTCDATGSVTGGTYTHSLGGLCGHNTFGTISNCYSVGSVTGGDGSRSLGGLCGSNYEATITNCYATSSVSAGTYSHSLGGLCGKHDWRGTITNCYATGSVTGGYVLGGLCGSNYEATISNCYATGSVTGDHDLGGLCGYNRDGISTNCFWDIETGGPDNGLGTPLPTAQMQTLSTFVDAGWDFVNIWWIFEGVGYPRHLWEIPVLHAEPEITLGTINSISWEPVVGNVEYYLECAEDPNFTSIVSNSGWITETSCEFIDLETGQQYWYRVKAINAAGVETGWSNVESSLQSTLGDAVDMLLDPASLKNENMKNALLNKIDAVLAMIDEGNYTGALNKLEHDILAKTNGCAETGEPDKNDWILACEQQSQVYGLVMETIEYVRSLIE